MKKIFLLISLTLSSLFINAQDTLCAKSCNKLQSVLPEEKEFSIGFDAVPVLNYFGNMFNSSSNSAAIGYQETQTIVGTYMKNSNTAYRGKLRIGFMNSSVNDSTNVLESNMTFGGGIQKYRGKTRLQGIYGVESTISFSNGYERVSEVETKLPKEFNFGIRAFVGVQYFVAKKIAIGAEYGWGAGFNRVDDNISLNVDVDNASGGIYLTAFF
jgi:hypothetical protein